MSTDSRKFATYAEYARKSLLRLNIVGGLSENLKTAIVIRGISDPQVKAAASNAKLQPNQLVEFLSVYGKSKPDFRSTHNIARSSHDDKRFNSRKREATKTVMRGKCYECGGEGHKKDSCPKRRRIETSKPGTDPSALNKTSMLCTYCKKTVHSVDYCFIKQRVETNAKQLNNVNFCRELSGAQHSDVMAVVINKVPVDALIDSGSDISLISSTVLKHINCNKVPTYRTMRGIGSQKIESLSMSLLL